MFEFTTAMSNEIHEIHSMYIQHFNCCCISELYFLTWEPDAAHRRAVVSMNPGHRCPHRSCHGPVIQQQQPAAVRYVHLAQQVPTEGHLTSGTTYNGKKMAFDGGGHTSHLDLTRTIAASGVSRSSSLKLPSTSVTSCNWGCRCLSCRLSVPPAGGMGYRQERLALIAGQHEFAPATFLRITKEQDVFHLFFHKKTV